MKRVYNNVVEAIGWTPIVKLSKFSAGTPHTFWAKMEFMNPGGSVKDRIGLFMIEEAERKGKLKPGGTIIEATSGNTGLGLAMVAAAKGYRCILVMNEKVSEEKRAILRAYGAEVIITPSNVSSSDPNSYMSVAKKMLQEMPDAFGADQFYNEDNPVAHYRTTGPEIWEQMGDKLDALVCGSGTGGTFSGTGKYLKEKNPKIQLVLADPVGSILRDLQQNGKITQDPQPYKVEGVGGDFQPGNAHLQILDTAISVPDKESFAVTRRLVAEEGICVGPSSGMALAAAMAYGKTLSKPSNILVIFPDSGRAYLSKTFNDDWMREAGLL